MSEGNPNITLNGNVNELNLQSAGNADIDAARLTARKIILSTNGNANIEVNTKALVEKLIKGNNDINNRFYATTTAATSGKFNYLWQTDNTNLITFKLKNNSLLPAKVTVISYRPNKRGNGTTGFMPILYFSKMLRFPVGTKIYLANSNQVDTVMSGAKISDQPLFLIVKAADQGKSFNIKP